MNKTFPYIILFIVGTILLNACGADRHLKKGDQYWAIGEYYEASMEYARAYAKTPAKDKEQRGIVAYKVGESNRLMNYSAKALAAYRNAARYGNVDTFTYYYIGELLRQQSDYKGAQAAYEAFLEKYPSHPGALRGIQSCVAAPALKAKGSDYTVREAKLFNANYDDYSPCMTEGLLVFSSTRKDAIGDDYNGVTGMKSGDLFLSKKDDKGKWQRPESLGENVNTQFDEGTPALSPDGKTLYFTRCAWDASYPRLAQIYQSARSDANWGKATLVEIAKDTLSSYAHPAVSPDGMYLYFVSDMPGGLGGLDIWRVALTGNHGLGAIENLGAPINTPGDEMFPTFRPNGDLYYSSNGKVGMGGLDLYCAHLDTAQRTWKVSHLPYPMNSNGDDFGMTFDGPYNRGFFSSNRSNRRGWDNIYTFECPEIVRHLKGWVYEQDGYELPNATVYIVGDDGTNKKIGLKLDGSFDETLSPGVSYLMLATCEGHLNYKQTLRVPRDIGSIDTTLQFPLPSAGIPVLVRNVFYDFDKATILPESTPALDRLVQLLKENSSVVIELSAHCDYRGSDAYNEKLSQRRAESVVSYLIEHGIEKERVVARGYGKSRPKIITKKFAERYPFLHAGDTLSEAFIKAMPAEQQDSCNALNRRTEFSVLRTTYGLFDEQGNLKPDAVSQNPSSKPDTTVKISANPSDSMIMDSLSKVQPIAAPRRSAQQRLDSLRALRRAASTKRPIAPKDSTKIPQKTKP